MVTKICKKCGIEKPITEFDKAVSCSDGHRCVCKACRKLEAQKRLFIHKKDPLWIEEQREKGRQKYRKYVNAGTYKQSKTPSDSNINIALQKRGFNMDGKQAHHWNYNQMKSVFIMSTQAHKILHKHISINYNDKFSYTENGKRIETKEFAENYFNKILEQEGIAEKVEFVDFSNIPTLYVSKTIRNTETFVQASKNKFGDKFGYNKTTWNGIRKDVIITCNNHNIDFPVRPKNHINSITGCCPECIKELRSKMYNKKVNG